MLLSELQLKNIEVIKDGEFDFLSPLAEIQQYKILTFINDIKYLETYKKNLNITCIICPKNLEDIMLNNNIGIIISENPKKTFYDIYNYLRENKKEFNFVSKIGKDTEIHLTSIVAPRNVIIGDNVIIGPNCVVEEGTVIQDNVIIGPNCLIGVESFTFEGNNKIIAQRGVLIGKNTNLLGNVTIEKGVYNNTRLEEYVKIGYNSIVEHDSIVGSETLICSGVVIAGRVKIGKKCYLGPGVVLRNGIELKDNSRANMGAIVTKNISSGEQVSGNFAIEHKKLIEEIKLKNKI